MPTKVRIVGKDIFNDTVHETVVPTSQTLRVPIVTKTTYTLVDIINDTINNDRYVTMMDDDGNIREDLKIDSELYNKLEQYLDKDNIILLTCITAMKNEKIIDFKVVK
jgi:translation elongation factor P/translation initiation factor 5A